MYNTLVIDHFENPRNTGEIPDADAVATVGNPECGDMMKIYLKIEDGRITDVKFKTFGCAAAIATSSIATEMVKGKTLEEAERLTSHNVIDALGALPPKKVHFSLLAPDAIRAAIARYRAKQS